MLKLPSFAKINWTLRILGKRPDGYHEVVTVLQTISLSDELSFEVRDEPGISLTCDDPAIPIDDSNLIVKAARALQPDQGVRIHLTKRIPAKGGLGGASSNAAVTLLALNHLWNRQFRNTDLLRIAAGLGADVPFFLIGGTVEARGIGTEITETEDARKCYMIVITPNATVSTSDAYASLKRGSLTTPESASILSSSFAEPVSGDSGQWSLHNDFEVVIFEIEPEIQRAKVALLDAGARGALLAGSGSSVFGIFDDEAARDRALRNLKCEPGWRTFSSHTLTRAEYRQLMGPYTGA